MSRLDVKVTISRFILLDRTASCHLEEAGEGDDPLSGYVVGTLAVAKPLVLPNIARICEEFANWRSTPEDILRFTKKYAPLNSSPNADGSFRFEISEWIAYQGIFRKVWRGLTPGGEWYAPDLAHRAKRFDLKYGGFALGRNSLEAEKLWPMLNACFAVLPVKRVRFCPADGCPTPFFVATHLKQTYCGRQSCIDWGDRQRKLEYWNRNKKKFLTERKQKRKGRTDGSHKTR